MDAVVFLTACQVSKRDSGLPRGSLHAKQVQQQVRPARMLIPAGLSNLSEFECSCYSIRCLGRILQSLCLAHYKTVIH